MPAILVLLLGALTQGLQAYNQIVTDLRQRGELTEEQEKEARAQAQTLFATQAWDPNQNA